MNINNASIVYYAIRNKETGDYLLLLGNGICGFGSNMCFINFFFNFEDAKDYINELVEEDKTLKDKLEVRKMKIIDIT